MRQFSIPKAGNTSEENEDAFCTLDKSLGGVVASFALSDGATEAAFSREWARTLMGSGWGEMVGRCAKATSAVDRTESLSSWLQPLQDQFEDNVSKLSLPWYARTKMTREGAFATFLGVRLTQGRGRRNWSAVACGDSCVFHISQGLVQKVFPLERAVDFGNRPGLIASHRSRGLPEIRHCENIAWEPGDVFVLATDALALWLLGDDSRQRVDSLRQCVTESAFACLVQTERTAGRMKNDDTTALIFMS